MKKGGSKSSGKGYGKGTGTGYGYGTTPGGSAPAKPRKPAGKTKR